MWDGDNDDLRRIALQPARPLARVLWGIGTLGAVIGVTLVVFAVFPSVRERQVSAEASLVVIGLLGALVYMVQRRVAGPPLVLEIGDAGMRLVTARDGRLFAAAPLESVVVTRAVHRTRYALYRGYVIEFPGRRRLTLGALGGERPDAHAPEMGDATHWIDPIAADCISELAPRG
jgi:hypothetical protein